MDTFDFSNRAGNSVSELTYEDDCSPSSSPRGLE